MLSEDAWSNLGVLLDKSEDRVLHDFWAAAGKVHESLETRIRLSEHTVAISRDNLARLEGGPKVVLYILVGEVVTDLSLHVQDPSEHLLGSKSMEGASKTKKTSAVAEERIAESRTNKVSGVGRDVSSLVVTVKSEVEAEDVVEAFVLLAALAKQVSEVVCPVHAGIELLSTNGINLIGAEDQGSDTWNLGKESNAVVECWLPVIGLANAVGISLGELGLSVQGSNSDRQLGHWMHILGEGLDEVEDVLWEVRLLGQLARKGADLGGRGDLAGQKKPEHSLWQHLSASGALGELLLAVLDGLAMEADTLVGVENGALPDHGLEASHTANGVANGDLADVLVGTGLDLLEKLSLGWNGILEDGLQVWFSGGIGPGA